jgi:hypothetical protein
MHTIPVTPPRRIEYSRANVYPRPSDKQSCDASDKQTQRPRITYASLEAQQGQRPALDDVLRALDIARKKRPRRKPKRTPRASTADGYRSSRGDSRTSAWARSAGYLQSITLRALNDLQLAGWAKPTRESMHDAIEHEIENRLRHLRREPEPGQHARWMRWAFIDEAQAERLIEHVLRSPFDDWAPDWIEDRRARGRRGGVASRKPPEWSDADLDRLDALRGATVAEQVVALGFSRSKIDRGRALLWARQVR